MSCNIFETKLLTITRLPFEARMNLNISEPGRDVSATKSSFVLQSSQRKKFHEDGLYKKQDKPMLPHHTISILSLKDSLKVLKHTT